jgi:uncharacterized protein (TIGR03435 family)
MRRYPRRWPTVAATVAVTVMAVILTTRLFQDTPAVLEDTEGKRSIQYGEFASASVHRVAPPGPPERRPPGSPTETTLIKCLGADGQLWVPPYVSDSTSPRRGRCTGKFVPVESLLVTAYASSRMVRVEGYPPGGLRGQWELPPEDRHPLAGYVGIEAVAHDPERVTKSELQQMLQALLEDRLKARVRTETRELDGYVLTIAQSGIKFKETNLTSPVTGYLREVFGDRRGSASFGLYGIDGSYTMQKVVNVLGRALGSVPIVDKTGLTGTYDMAFGLEEIPSPGGSAEGGRRGGGPQNQGTPQFKTPVPKAVEDQLGLHLERAKVQVEFIVVDHVELPARTDPFP